ncbi:MAG: hypothetical protein D3926_22885 [Desulfobacteraceae bacterium]|nr:MAG: hypothetical protein D3926_22885 [Desulfobacteraceae bacterium]
MKNQKQTRSASIKERQAAYDSLPPHVKENLSAEEVELFLKAEEWPDSLFKKLEEFIVPGD